MAEKPKREFRAGSVRAMVREHQRTTKDNREFVAQAVTIERRYRDGNTGEWRSTNSFNVRDLPNVIVVAGKAFEFLRLKVRDPAEE